MLLRVTALGVSWSHWAQLFIQVMGRLENLFFLCSLLSFVSLPLVFFFFYPLSHILCNDVIFNDERNRLQPDVASASNSFGRDLKNAKESREIIKKSQNR